MEVASYLAGERWSDHPACTHPLLASLARWVNDCTSDAARPRLALLIPSVIGLTGDDVRLDAAIALRATRTALPVAAADRQRVLAVGVLSSQRILCDLDGGGWEPLEAAARWLLDQAPDAHHWARRFSREIGVSPRGFQRHAAPAAVRYAAVAVAESCSGDVDERLHDMLAGAIHDVRELLGRPGDLVRPEPAAWAEACGLVGRAD